MTRYPKFFSAKQNLASRTVADVSSATVNTIDTSKQLEKITSGQSVAIGVGSRGIANLPEIVRSVVQRIALVGGEPFLVPAMGSHGGANAKGQKDVLASLGVSETAMGCPVRSSMDTVSLGLTKDGFDVRFDKLAFEAEHVVVVNRIKPHTRLYGTLQSGLVKMLMIGLGKHIGASTYHQSFAKYDHRLDRMAGEVMRMIFAKVPVLMGVAIIEDGYEQTAGVEAIPASEVMHREPGLLKQAESLLPSIPFKHLDLLIVDQIGKEISGTGMDTNVIGRKWNDNIGAPDEWPKIKQIYVRSLTKKSAGNATGIGIAEYCHRRVVDAMDQKVTRINCITGEHVTAGRIPLTFYSDKEVFDAVMMQNASKKLNQLRWLAIRDTLSLQHLYCSESLANESERNAKMEVSGPAEAIKLDGDDNLVLDFESLT